jgi:hypothetical protein
MARVMNKRIGGAALAFAAVAVFATACGSADPSTPTSTGGTDYASCLRDNGVNLPQLNGSGRPTDRPSGNPSGRPTAFPSGQPRPSGSGGFRGGGPGGFFGTAAPDGVDQQTWEKAQKACESLRPTAFPGGGGNGNGGGGRDAAYRNCLTEHGVTASGPVDQLDTTDAKVAAAVTACAPLKPSPRPSAS